MMFCVDDYVEFPLGSFYYGLVLLREHEDKQEEGPKGSGHVEREQHQTDHKLIPSAIYIPTTTKL